MLAGHPERVVTLLLTDVEGSTAAWEASPDDMARRLEDHDRLVAEVVAAHGGQLLKTKGEGDSTFSVFEVAHAAVSAAVDLQRRLRAAGEPLRVRAAVHSGPVQERGGDVYGPTPNTGARVRATAHGGQVVVSEAAAALCTGGRLPDGIDLRSLGTFRLRDVSEPLRLHQAIHPDLPERFPPLRSVEAPGTTLPAPITALVGRDDDVRKVAKAVGENRLVTLSGLGGIGKTRLALAAAETLRGDAELQDGVWWVELAPLPPGGDVAAAVAETIGAKERGAAAALERVTGHLHRANALVVLDNCEHVVEEAAVLVDAVLQACPSIRILATSREALEVAGEHRIRVEPLAADGEEAPATRLLLERAGGAVSPEVAVEVAKRVDGIPLAIELVAAQVASLGAEAVVGRLSDALLGARRRGGPERHRSLRAALESSYTLLDERAARALLALAVFPAGFSFEGAEAVARATVADVAALARSSLVASDGSRFRMLEPVRQFAADLLVAAGEEEEVMHALLGWTAGRGREEHEAALVAIRWALAAGFVDEAAAAITARRPAWLASGWVEARPLVRAVPHGELDPARVAALVALDAELTRRMGELGDAEELAARALTMARELQDDRVVAQALTTQLGCCLMLGRLDEGERLGAVAIRACEEAGEAASAGFAMNLHGAIAFTAGDPALAELRWAQSAEMLKAIGDISSLPATLNNLAYAAYAASDLGRARELVQEAIALAQEAGVAAPVSFGIGLLGRIALEEGDLDEAGGLLEESLRLDRALGSPTTFTNTLAAIVSLAIEVGDLAKAAALAAEGLDACRQHGIKTGEAGFLLLRAELANAAGKRDDAVDDLMAAAPLGSGDRGVLGRVLLGLAEVRWPDAPDEAAELLGAVGPVLAGTGKELSRRERGRQEALREELAAVAPAGLRRGEAVDPASAASLLDRHLPPAVSQAQDSSGS